MTANFDLAASRALLEMTEAGVRRELDADHGEVRDDVAYEGLEGVTQLYNRDRFAGRVYLRDGRVAIVYVPHGPALSRTSVKQLIRGLHGKRKEMRSRAGKEFTHVVYAEDGIAFSADHDDLQFVEVFRPRSLKDYLAQVYRDPGPFIR